MNQEYYYRLKKAGNDYFVGFMGELKKQNPDVDIKGVLISKKDGQKIYLIVTPQPIENLQPTIGYFGNALNRTIIPETSEEYNSDLEGDYLHFNVSEKMGSDFCKQLNELNPNAGITYEYDKEQKIGTIKSSIALDEINFPEGYYGGIGINEKGHVGYLNDRITNYSIILDKNYEYKIVPKAQKYFASKTKNNVSLKTIEEPVETEVETNKEEKNEKDYLRLIAAQNESERTLKIVKTENTINEERRRKIHSAILSGVFMAGMVAAVHFSGFDVDDAIRMEIEAINSMDALKEYLGMITPAMWATAAGTVINIINFINHRRRERNAAIELEDMRRYAPENLQDVVERQARNK